MPNAAAERVACKFGNEDKREAADCVAWARNEIADIATTGFESEPDVAPEAMVAVETLKAAMIADLSVCISMVAGADAPLLAADAAIHGARNMSVEAWWARAQRLVDELNVRCGFF